jgi:nitrate reductase NapD
MNIASLVVRTRPDHVDPVRERLERIPGVEIHGEPVQGRLVVTVEDVPGRSTADTLIEVHQTEGVVAATLAYAYCDD